MSGRSVSRRFRRTTIWLILCLTILVGLGMARAGYRLNGWWMICLVPAFLSLWRRDIVTVILISLLGITLGLQRGALFMDKLSAYAPYLDKKITITAMAKQDGTYNKYKQMSFDASNVVVTRNGQALAGKVSIAGFGENAIFAGDTVQVTGKLKTSLGSYQGRMTYAQVHVLSHHNSIVNELRRRFTAGMQSALPEPLGSFGMGLLIGQRSGLPADITQTLLMVGLTHIIAVSGYNLTILLRSADKIGGKHSKRFMLLLSLSLIGIFLLFAGTSASIVRAAIVSLLSIMAAYYGRNFKPLLLLLLAGAITAFANPFYIWSDSGWYLSFLAFYGVMILAPLVSRNWPERFRESIIVMVALESLCAEAMTLPFVLHAFGQMSLIGLAANVLVAALVPLAMLLSLIAGLAGMLIPAVAGWLAWPAQVVLTYMLDTAGLLSRIPHVFRQNIAFSWQLMIASYVLLGVGTWLLSFKKKRENATITDKNGKEVTRERTLQVVNNQA